MTKINIILSLIIIIILFIYSIYTSKKYKRIIQTELYKKINKIKKILYILSILLFIIFLIINLSILGTNPPEEETIKCFLKALSIAVIALPISLDTLYLVSFNDEENYSHIKTIITDIYDKELINKYNKANINVILLSDKKTDLKTISEKKFTKSDLKETIQIKTDNNKILDKQIDKYTTKKEFKSLDTLYNKIINSRGVHDNYLRTIKYLIATYLPIILSYLFLIFMQFPVTYNILLIALLKLYTTLISRIVYKHLPYDKDIPNRQVKPTNVLIPSQELFLLLIDCFIIFFTLTLPYMYVLAKDTGILFANTIYFVLFAITNTLLTYYYLNDSSFIFNIIKNITKVRIHIFTIISIIFIIFINFNNYFLTRNIGIKNILGCLIISVTGILILELTKLARFISTKGRKNNETKNN